MSNGTASGTSSGEGGAVHLPAIIESAGAQRVAAQAEVSARAQTSRSLITSIRADLGEAEAYRAALVRGEAGLMRPIKANVQGPDFITVGRRNGKIWILVNDAKASTTGRFPRKKWAVPTRWRPYVEEALKPGNLDLNDPKLEGEIRQAYKRGRVMRRHVHVDYSPRGQGKVSGFGNVRPLVRQRLSTPRAVARAPKPPKVPPGKKTTRAQGKRKVKDKLKPKTSNPRGLGDKHLDSTGTGWSPSDKAKSKGNQATSNRNSEGKNRATAERTQGETRVNDSTTKQPKERKQKLGLGKAGFLGGVVVDQVIEDIGSYIEAKSNPERISRLISAQLDKIAKDKKRVFTTNMSVFKQNVGRRFFYVLPYTVHKENGIVSAVTIKPGWLGTQDEGRCDDKDPGIERCVASDPFLNPWNVNISGWWRDIITGVGEGPNAEHEWAQFRVGFNGKVWVRGRKFDRNIGQITGESWDRRNLTLKFKLRFKKTIYEYSLTLNTVHLATGKDQNIQATFEGKVHAVPDDRYMAPYYTVALWRQRGDA